MTIVSKIKLYLILTLFISVPLFSCNMEQSDSNNSKNSLGQLNKTLENSNALPILGAEITEEKDQNFTKIYQNAETILNSSKSIPVGKSKLICIPNSLYYLGFSLSDYNPNVDIIDQKLILHVHELNELKNRCEKIIQNANPDLELAKLVLRYESKDYELKLPDQKSLSPIKITKNYIDSLATNQIHIQLLCKKNNASFGITFLGKPFYETLNKINNKNNSLFIYADKHDLRNTIENFYHCEENLSAISESDNLKFNKIYFINDFVLPEDENTFLIQNTRVDLATKEQSGIVCYFLNKDKQLQWHWAFNLQNKTNLQTLDGKWENGEFLTATPISKIKEYCENSFYEYSKDWEYFNAKAAQNFWSWSAPIRSTSDTNEFPFKQIIEFSDNIAINEYIQPYSGSMTSRIATENTESDTDKGTQQPNLNDYLSKFIQIPIRTWSRTNNDVLDNPSGNSTPLSFAVQKYLKDSTIWSGALTPNNSLFIFHVGRKFFTNYQYNSDQLLSNLKKDLKSALNILIQSGAKFILIPHLYDPQIFSDNYKKIDQLNFEKYGQKVNSIIDEIILNKLNEVPSDVKINILKLENNLNVPSKLQNSNKVDNSNLNNPPFILALNYIEEFKKIFKLNQQSTNQK